MPPTWESRVELICHTPQAGIGGAQQHRGGIESAMCNKPRIGSWRLSDWLSIADLSALLVLNLWGEKSTAFIR